MAIERGFNIVDDCGHSAIDTLVFAVRPMGIPQDLVVRFKRMVGLVCGQSRHLDSRSPSFEREIREGAWRRWVTLERDEALSLRDHASFDDTDTRHHRHAHGVAGRSSAAARVRDRALAAAHLLTPPSRATKTQTASRSAHWSCSSTIWAS
ncbi:MAG: hypothetical protein ACLT5H_10335 [Collinsella stercoris]|uniref:hypothetical protein n=1 Tax=Collinsella stercoris TaxID=147206 RepID=UPI003995BCE7